MISVTTKDAAILHVVARGGDWRFLRLLSDSAKNNLDNLLEQFKNMPR